MSTEAIRLAIVSTPRSGNNWLQSLLARLYDVPRLSPTNATNVAWERLPAECVLILHWRRTPELLERLRTHGFRVLTVARHPLDVLLSILHFTLREPTDGWLEGEGGNEQGILGAAPTSADFLAYATGPRAGALLGVTWQWWEAGDCLRVRYEDLVVDAPRALRHLTDSLTLAPRIPLEEAIESSTLARMRRDFAERRHHFWQGQPGLWRSLLPAAHARAIADAHPKLFAPFGYTPDGDPELTLAAAEQHWRELLGLSEGTDPALAVLRRSLTQVKRDLEVTRAQLAELQAMGPLTLQFARHLKRWAGRFPRLAKAVKRLLPNAR